MRRILAVLTALCAVVCSTITAQAQSLQWIRHEGTVAPDYGRAVSVDGLGNVYNSGATDGNLGGTHFGASDGFVSKHDPSGTLVWTRQFGTNGNDRSTGISVDNEDVYVTGYTAGILGGASAGGIDAFLSKYDPSGALLWTQQLGTSANDAAASVSLDGLGNTYVAGTTGGDLAGANAGDSDAFLAKYDASGSLLWTEQLGSSSFDQAISISSDGLGNVYIAGRTGGDLGSPTAGGVDAFLARYDANGMLHWTRQFGTAAEDAIYGVSADKLGNVFVVGNTSDTTTFAWMRKYDPLGNLLWTRQTPSSAEGRGVSADGLGNVYFSGQVFYGDTVPQPSDAFVNKYDSSGTLLWDERLDIGGEDYGWSVSADGQGDVFLTGWYGQPGVYTTTDVYVAKYSTVPEPVTAMLLIVAVLGLTLMRQW